MLRYAEDANYWDTAVSPSISQGEIGDLLEKFGADGIQTIQGSAGGRYAWMIRFQWESRVYRFTFAPLTCRFPDKTFTRSGVKRTNQDQSRYQMGRIALNFVKAILTAAEATPAALFGFLELPGVHPGQAPMTTAELDVAGLTGMLPDVQGVPLLEKAK
ncbi:MAG: hypothetical protein ABFD24_06070 [Anaerolineaceae bacterium]